MRNAKRQRKDMRCDDCRIDTSLETGIGHYYTARDDVWCQAGGTDRTILCIDCLEVRLGRRVVAADLTVTPIEILARFLMWTGSPLAAGLTDDPLPPDERQREFESWRADPFTVRSAP